MYSDFSENYDLLMQDVDYTARAEYLCGLFKTYDRMPTLLLDLACGTGGFSVEFANRGVSVIGVDISPDMLSKAQEKSVGRDVLYLCQDAANLDLYGTVDGAICCMDSINHITDYGDLCKSFAKVSLFLEKERLFIFDVNTPYKHESVLGNNTFVIECENCYCVWNNSYNEKSKITEICLDFFNTADGKNYIRTTDYIEEKAYTDLQIISALEGAGFTVLGCFADMEKNPPKSDTERVVYVARKE